MFDGREQQQADLLRNADAAMNHAMELGHNGYVFFESSMSDDAQTNCSWCTISARPRNATSWCFITSPSSAQSVAP